MALIICPECGKEISEKSKSCIYCGYPLQEDVNVKCIINGQEFDLSFLVYNDLAAHNDEWERDLAKADLVGKLRKITSCGLKDAHMFVEKYIETKFLPKTAFFPSIAEAEQKAKEEANKPKCPTCGSTNISPIGNLERAASMWFWGLGSKKFGKSYKCNDCKHTW